MGRQQANGNGTERGEGERGASGEWEGVKRALAWEKKWVGKGSLSERRERRQRKRDEIKGKGARSKNKGAIGKG